VHRRMVVYVQVRHVADAGLSGRAGVARRAVELLAQGRLGELPRESVLPPAAADDQHINLRSSGWFAVSSECARVLCLGVPSLTCSCAALQVGRCRSRLPALRVRRRCACVERQERRLAQEWTCMCSCAAAVSVHARTIVQG